MGNTIKTRDDYGSISIQLEKNVYGCGEQVNGVVHLNLQQVFPSNELKLIVDGKEIAQLIEARQRTRYNHSTKQNETYTEYITHKGEQSFFGYTFPLYTFNGQYFQPGQYSFPFAFKLLDNCPASFYQSYSQHGTNFGQISYTLWAGLQCRNDKKLIIFSDREFQVDQNFLQTNVAQQFQSDFMKTYCSKKQELDISVQINQNVVRARDNIDADIIVDVGKSELDVERLQISITQELFIRVPHDGFSRQKVIKHNKIDFKWNKFEKIADTKYKISTNYQLNFEEQNITVKGDCIINSFYFRVKVVPKGCRNCCCGEDAQVLIPITIQNKILYPNYNIPFQNWQPQVMDPYVGAIGSNFQTSDDMKQRISNLQNVEYPEL